MSNDKYLEFNFKKRESDLSQDKELVILLNENKDLKEINMKLLHRTKELEKKLKLYGNISNMEDDQIFKIKEEIYNKDTKIETTIEIVRHLEIENNLMNGKIKVLDDVLQRKIKIEDVFQMENEIFKYFNDMIIKNIDKREEIKRNNKKLLEILILLGKEYKNIK